MKSNHRWNVVIGIGCLTVVAIPFLIDNSLSYYARPRKLNNLVQVTRLTRLSFPPTSVLIEGNESRSLSPYIVAKVSMRKTELQKFKSQNSIFEKLIKDGCGFTQKDFPNDEAKKWDLKSLRNKPCLSGANRPGVTGGFWMIIDADKKDALIYLYYQD